MKNRWTGQKGSFGDAELPVAKRYPPRAERSLMLAVGAGAAAVVLALVAGDHLLRGGRLASNGPLSSNHAAFGADCSNCHDPTARQASDERCSACHEKYGDELGVYNFAAHYLYRSDDFRRQEAREHEMPCFSCHVEHEGREAEITRVADVRCKNCHFGSFRRHPQFDFAAEKIPDSQALAFAHVHHVREVMKRQQLAEVERSCLYCHNARRDGRGFEPIDFDRHCDVCHLTATIATPGLPIAASERDVGILTLDEIVRRGEPGTRWAYFTDPNEYRRRGSLLVKGPLHHRDPWLLHNLRRLRRRLYPDAGLADLLLASADAPATEVRSLYREAIATLEEQAQGLRGSPERAIQAELARIDKLLAVLAREVERPYASLDESRFLLALEEVDPALSPAEMTAIETLIGELTTPCRQCHEVRAGTIARVASDQRTLRRAEFDHRAHIVQARCLDCHAAIPIAENLDSETELAPALDSAGIQNLPTIESCRECHSPKLASDRCVSCHLFHPDKGRRSDLLLYLEEAP